jgi:uncharacterized protein (TIGR02611 family)
MPLFVFKTLQHTWRVLRIIAGFVLLALGIVLLVGPGPGWLVILLGLGLLAVDFALARRLLDRLKLEGARLRNLVFRRQPPTTQAS